MPIGGLWQWAYEIHAHPFKRDPNDGKGNQWGWPVREGLLALMELLAKVLHLGHHSGPVELVPDLLQCALVAA